MAMEPLSSFVGGEGDGLAMVSFAASVTKEEEQDHGDMMMMEDFQQHSFEESSFFQHNQSKYLNQSTAVEGLTSVNQLHNAFVSAIANMPTRLQLFEVMDEWMIHIERALDIDRHLDPEIPDEVHDKLHRMLKKEYETWDLIKTLYFYRLSEREDGDQQQRFPFNQQINDKFRLNEMKYATDIMDGDKSLQEMAMIINWLELNYSRQADPDLTPKLIAWEQTLDSMKRDALLGRKGGCMVSHIDPDAPFRERKELHPLDSDEEQRIQRGAFHYLRIGNIEKCVNFLHQSGHIAKAKAILGCLMSQKLDAGNIDEDEEVEDEFILPGDSFQYGDHSRLPSSRRNTTTSSSANKNANKNKANNNTKKSSFVVTGNPLRLLWKKVAWSICEQDLTSKWERAIIGSCCGHRKSMLEVSNTWEDKLWAYLKAAVNTKVEQKLTGLNSVSKPVDLPADYLSQALDVDQVLEDLDYTLEKKKQFTIDHMFQLLQKCAMKEDLDIFLNEVHLNLDSLFEDADHPIILDHLIRFLTHALLAFAITELSYNEPLTDLACDAYINVLVKNGLFVAIPFYVQKLSFNLQISVVVSQIRPEIRYSIEEIQDFLQGAADNSLDVLGIATAIVDKLRDEVDDFDVDMLQWIGCCYDLVENHDLVMFEFLRYTVWISRKYLMLGDMERVKRLVKQITQECITAVEKIAPTLVREYVCYREYLEAEDALTLWKQAKSQRPTPLDQQLQKMVDPMLSSLPDRALYDQRKKEVEIAQENWKKAVDFHGKSAIDAFMKILMFPDGGWLRGCCNPSDEDETIHINSVRRIIMKKITFVVLNLIKERNLADKFREFVHVLCDGRRRILEEFNPVEIGSIFKVVEEFTKITSPDLMVLPKA